MSKKIKDRRSAQKAGSAANGRNNAKRQRREVNNDSKTQAPRIIANSLFALTLNEKSGIEVSLNQSNSNVFAENTNGVEEMYYDLLNTFKNALKLYTGEVTNADPYKSGMSIDNSILYLINGFKNSILPTGFELNVDYRYDKGYHFTIFKEIETPCYWMTFEIKPIVKKLYRTNIDLHEFFIVFIKSFMTYTKILNWYNGGFGYAEYAVEEHLEDWENFESEFNSPEEAEKERRKRLATVWQYEHGEVKKYQKLICEANPITVEELLQALSKFNKRNHIVKWMYEACEFMKIQTNIWDFIYEEAFGEDRDGFEEGVKIEQQATIIWDSRDIYSITEEEVLEAESSSAGVQNGFLNIHVTKDIEKIDWSTINEQTTWIDRLEKLNVSYTKLIRSIKRS